MCYLTLKEIDDSIALKLTMPYLVLISLRHQDHHRLNHNRNLLTHALNGAVPIDHQLTYVFQRFFCTDFA